MKDEETKGLKGHQELKGHKVKAFEPRSEKTELLRKRFDLASLVSFWSFVLICVL